MNARIEIIASTGNFIAPRTLAALVNAAAVFVPAAAPAAALATAPAAALVPTDPTADRPVAPSRIFNA